ncbi:TonB-dependent receptor [uncultured Desulfobacter sp.]|uniref:TonB-dependent receptor n=1 Tax=uncultured Desulfobacter sp. TaxID=240139 RepID=UPI0029F4F61E|nr:TonB-dependent receptor [uncultured Desulfobacter sp.]
MQFWKKVVTESLSILSVILFILTSAHGEESYELQPITVTANKSSENIQKVPMAITAFTETELEDAGVETIGDVIDMIPNLTQDSSTQGQKTVSYRGIGTSTFTGKNPVVIYIDGIPLDDRTNYEADLVDIERVEVLRGPQGTLYGKSAIGGVINIISKKPDNTMESKLSGEWGENETYAIKGTVNGPIVKDKLFLGLSAKYRETRGFMKNDNPQQDYFDSEQSKMAKALLRWLPSDQLEVNFHAGINQRRDGGAKTISASDQVQYHANKNPADKSHSDDINSALNISYRTEFAELNSITTYRDTEKDYWRDMSSLNVGYTDCIENTDGHSFSQEFRIQSPQEEKRMKWLGGLYYSREGKTASEYGNVYDSEAYYGYSTKYDYPFDLAEESIAAFGQITIPIFSSVSFTAGLRYEKTNKELNYKSSTTRTDTGELIIPKVEWNREEDWDALLPKGVLSWNMNQDAMIYFSIAQGYLAGGFNRTNDDKETAKFDEQTALNYEIGAKTAWFDNRLFLNTTLFYVSIEDMHVYSMPEPGIWIASNAAEAHSQGIEIEVKARPCHGLDIMASFGWTESEFDDYENYDGNTTELTPEYTFNLAVQYRHASGIFVRGEMEGYGKTYYDEANTIKRDPFELYNLKIGYETSRWDAYFYVKNLMDKEYFSSMGSWYHAVGAPRTLGLVASVRF